jgi:Helix-turn-helix domain/Bacterial regulatory proteins, gntR family
MTAGVVTGNAPAGGAPADDRGGILKYRRVVALVRARVADGTLHPGQPAPSGAELSRITGYSTLTCRKALRVLIADGVLVPGPSRNARPRVAGDLQPQSERDLADSTRALSAGLAARRRAAGLTQPQLAALAAVSVTTIGHAETGRVWQSRRFWERADAALDAGGDLLRLHDAYRAASASCGRDQPPSGRPGAELAAPETAARAAAVATSAAPGRGGPSYVTIVWDNGAVTTVRPPGL